MELKERLSVLLQQRSELDRLRGLLETWKEEEPEEDEGEEEGEGDEEYDVSNVWSPYSAYVSMCLNFLFRSIVYHYLPLVCVLILLTYTHMFVCSSVRNHTHYFLK